MREIEVKFKITAPVSIRKKLKSFGAKFLGRVIEKTIRFDYPDEELEKQGKFLRIKTGFKNVITLKEKIKNKNFKEREEIELEVSDPKVMEQIIEKLGFTKKRVMEKRREKWQLGRTEIVIDKLSIGTFIEIEGTEKSIKRTVELLGLDFGKRITKTYWELLDGKN